MSKRRRKNKVSENSNQGNFMGGLNPQMLDMLGLGDVDVNKVSEVLSSMGSLSLYTSDAADDYTRV